MLQIAEKWHGLRPRSSGALRACTRKPPHRGPPERRVERSTTSSDIRSSSCARTASRARDDTRRRRARGRARCAERTPRRRRPARRAGPRRAASPAPASPSPRRALTDADAARVASCRPLRTPAARGPRRSPRARRPASSAPGTCAELGRGDHALPAGAQHLHQPPAARGVELAHHVVEQHQRRRRRARRRAPRARPAAARAGRAAAGPATRTSAARGRRAAATSSSRCGPWPVKPRSRSPSVRSASSATSSSASAARRARAVARAPRSPSSPSAVGVAARTGRPAARRASARSRISASAVARQLGVPGRAASRGSARPARIGRDQRVALRERRRVLAPRPGARRPQRGDDLVEVRAAQRRRTQHSSSRSGRNTATSGRAAESVSRSTGAPSTRRRFASPGWNPTVIVWPPVRVAARSSSRRVRLVPNRTTSRSFAGPARARRAGEVQRLQQVRLAGAVAAGDHRQPRPGPQLRRLVASGSRAA